MQLGQGGECLACKGGSRTTNQNPQQPLVGMIFTNADPRYAGRLDDKQGGDTIVTMERVREAITFNVELADESKWLWLTSQQPFWQKSGKQWALQLSMWKARRAAGGQRRRQFVFGGVLARRRATLREFSEVFFIILYIPKMTLLKDTCLTYE